MPTKNEILLQVLPQPHHNNPNSNYVTAPPATYNGGKHSFSSGLVSAAASSLHQYVVPNTPSGSIHYGTHMFHPATGAVTRYSGYGPVSPPNKIFYNQ